MGANFFLLAKGRSKTRLQDVKTHYAAALAHVCSHLDRMAPRPTATSPTFSSNVSQEYHQFEAKLYNSISAEMRQFPKESRSKHLLMI